MAEENGVNPFSLAQVTMDIHDEVFRQYELWGRQDHQNGTDADYAIEAERMKRLNDANAEQGSLDWTGILGEEVYEAFAETDRDALRTELVQVAAVAVTWLMAIDRQNVA